MAKILVVDDDSSIRFVLECSLDGHDVTSVGSGAEAILSVEQDPPDLILMDYNMPEMTGLRASELISEKRYVPTIFITAMDKSVFPASIPAEGIIAKPFDPMALRRHVDAHLSITTASQLKPARYA